MLLWCMETLTRKISLGAALDQWVYDSAENLRYKYDLSPEDTVVDIGACKGDFAEVIYARYGCNMIMIEPTNWIHEVRVPGQKIEAAAWKYDGDILMGGSFFATSVYEVGIKVYKSVDVARILKDEYALVKINIEGGEYELLSYMIEQDMITRFKNIQVQFHVVGGMEYEDWYSKIAAELAKTHELTFRYAFVWENWKLKK